jgi:transcriptional regulator GlxA family with amidase domain
MSIYRFLRLFKRMTSQTPRKYLMATRLRAAATRLLETPDKVLDIAFGVGFDYGASGGRDPAAAVA